VGPVEIESEWTAMRRQEKTHICRTHICQLQADVGHPQLQPQLRSDAREVADLPVSGQVPTAFSQAGGPVTARALDPVNHNIF
jgi:hypothetical protein